MSERSELAAAREQLRERLLLAKSGSTDDRIDAIVEGLGRPSQIADEAKELLKLSPRTSALGGLRHRQDRDALLAALLVTFVLDHLAPQPTRSRQSVQTTAQVLALILPPGSAPRLGTSLRIEAERDVLKQARAYGVIDKARAGEAARSWLPTSPEAPVNRSSVDVAICSSGNTHLLDTVDSGSQFDAAIDRLTTLRASDGARIDYYRGVPEDDASLLGLGLRNW